MGMDRWQGRGQARGSPPALVLAWWVQASHETGSRSGLEKTSPGPRVPSNYNAGFHLHTEFEFSFLLSSAHLQVSNRTMSGKSPSVPPHLPESPAGPQASSAWHAAHTYPHRVSAAFELTVYRQGYTKTRRLQDLNWKPFLQLKVKRNLKTNTDQVFHWDKIMPEEIYKI